MEKYYLDDKIVQDIIAKVPLNRQATCFRELARVFEIYAKGIEEGMELVPRKEGDLRFSWTDDNYKKVRGKVVGNL
ncbi:hypothetical protein VP496E541_P0182 [Vibrio phage 496E54-1]|nr:hypothetical protein VP495E541_P0182 [Vibrio phage 495E54-1]CAH9014299.1 hypothetical protein VP496E541_P0182 [Vibrio phage 496E54-1]